MVRFGYFPEFADPTLLFWGEADDLSRFAALLRRAASSPRREFPLADEPLFRPTARTSVVIVKSSAGLGLRRRGRGAADAEFRWAMDRDLARRFADLIEAVARSAGPGHHYLDAPEVDDALVVVSKGEYDLAFGEDEEVVPPPR
jgi:hypothetical protein